MKDEMEREHLDEVLGITRCARCGHRLDGQIECPFCAVVEQEPRSHPSNKWVYLMACFLTSPLSIYSVVRTDRLSLGEKVLAVSGCVLWAGVVFLLM